MIRSDFDLLSKLGSTIRKQNLLQPDDTVIVAISGGADSTALLDLLNRLSEYNLKLIAAHLNHCLRGNDSDADEEFCRRLAARYSVPFESRRINIRELARTGQLNLEDAGRRARISFLDELRAKHDGSAIAMAHHADDQAETLLMRLLRGSGMTGLSGMGYRNSRGYIRPLLETTRHEIEQYLRERGLSWCEDASNQDTIYLRNRIRHELLPLLEQYNPAIRTSLAATASILHDDEAVLVELTERAFNDTCSTKEGGVVCNIKKLLIFDQALQRRIFRHAFKQVAGSLDGLSRRHTDAVIALMASERPNSQLALPQGITVVREYGSLLFKHSRNSEPETLPDFQITGPGQYKLSTGGSLTIEIINHPPDFLSRSDYSVHVDLNSSPFPWRVRTFHPGDRMVPFGMIGHKKVKDIFIDRKIPQTVRRHTPLLYCGDRLIWLAGISASELCRVGRESNNTALVTYLSG